MPPKKGKKMDLNAFLTDETIGGSWADEMDALPTGPSGAAFENGGLGGSHLSRGGMDRGGFGDRPGRGGGDFGDRPLRAEIPIPDAPPYTAFVGNLSFDVTEADLEHFFGNLKTTSIRLVSGLDSKPKGFGYVEFGAVDDLKAALDMTGNDMGGRTVRISVAEPPKNREGRADEDITWTRQGPLAPLPGRSGGFDRAPRGDGFGSSRDGPEVERDGPIRGGKFAPSSSSDSRRTGGFGSGQERSFSGAPPGGREYTPDSEREGPIRGGKFTPSAAPPERSSFGGDRRSASGPAPADEEKTWTRQGPLPSIPGQRTSSFGTSRSVAPGDSAEQPQRQRLQLSARSTAPSSAEGSPSGSPAPSSRPSPFGAAKPVDNTAREREVEAKLAKEREQQQTKTAAKKEEREKDPALAPGVIPSTARKSSNPFGDAKPVDVSQREKEVEEKLAKARAEATAALQAKSAETKNAVSKKSDETPGSPNPPSHISPPTSLSKADAITPAAVPTAKASLRKEGFSYSSAANKKEESRAEIAVDETK